MSHPLLNILQYALTNYAVILSESDYHLVFSFQYFSLREIWEIGNNADIHRAFLWWDSVSASGTQLLSWVYNIRFNQKSLYNIPIYGIFLPFKASYHSCFQKSIRIQRYFRVKTMRFFFFFIRVAVEREY